MGRSATVVVLIVLAASLGPSAPMPRAGAEHWNRIVLHSGTGLLLDGGLVGCHTPGGHIDTDWILPGSTTLHVRVLGTEKPSDASTLSFSGLANSTRCADGVCKLSGWTFEPEGTVSHPEPLWDSTFYPISRTSSVIGGKAVVTICFDVEGTDCVSRTYRTLA